MLTYNPYIYRPSQFIAQNILNALLKANIYITFSLVISLSGNKNVYVSS